MQMTSESLRVQFENEIASARSEFNITAESLRVSFENEISSARSEFSATAESMRISFESDIGSVRSEIGVQADRISLVVTSGSNPTIKAAQIVASVNNSGSSVLISADKILLDGNTTVGGMMSVSGGSLVVAGGIKSTGSVSAEHFYLGTGAIPTASLEYGVYNLQIVQSGNTYTLQKQSYSDTTWVDVGNFSRAVTSLGYAWGSGATVGQLTVTAYPQNYSTVLLGLVVDGSWTDQSFTGRVKYYEGQDDEQTYNTNVNFYGAVSSPTWNDNGMKYGDTYSGGIYKPTQRRVTVGVSITGHGTVVGQTFGLKQSGGKVLLWKDSSSGDSMAGVDLDVTLDTGSISGSGASGSRTVKAKAGNDEMDSATLTDYGDGYSAGRTVGRADMGVAYDSAYIVGQTTKKVVKVTVGGAAYVEPTLDVGSVTGSGTSGKRTVTLKIGAVNVTSSEITDYGDGYTAGRNDVTITKGSWSSGTISFTKSAGTASTKEVNLTAASTTWSGNTGSRVIWDGTAADSQHGVSTGYTVTVDATTRYKEGWKGCYDSMSTTATTSGTLNYGATASVVIKQTDKDGNEQTRVTKTYTAPADRWQDGYDNARLTYKYTQAEYDAALATVPSGYFNSATITFDGSRDLGSSDEGNDGAVTAAAKNGNTTLGSGSKTIHMGVGSWSSGKIGVTCRLDNSNGKCINRVYVSKPSVTGVRLVKTGGTYTVYGKVGGSSEIQLASGLSG